MRCAQDFEPRARWTYGRQSLRDLHRRERGFGTRDRVLPHPEHRRALARGAHRARPARDIALLVERRAKAGAAVVPPAVPRRRLAASPSAPRRPATACSPSSKAVCRNPRHRKAARALSLIDGGIHVGGDRHVAAAAAIRGRGQRHEVLLRCSRPASRRRFGRPSVVKEYARDG